MLNNRVSTAQIADELLNEFYVRNNHELLRKKHRLKVQKKLAQPGALSEVQSMHLSQSLEHLDRIDGGTFTAEMQGMKKGRPLSKSVSFGINEYHSGASLSGAGQGGQGGALSFENQQNRSTSYAPSQGAIDGLGGAPLVRNTNPAAIDMMHRVTFQEGGSPGKFAQLGEGGDKPVPVINEAGEEELDNATIAANAREIQYNAMNESTIMQQILTEILDLHKDVEKARLAMEAVVPEENIELLARVDLANVTYVKLFERMLAETLLIQRSKFKSQTDAIRDLRAQLAQAVMKEQGSREAEIMARNEHQQMEIETATLNRMIEQLQQLLDETNLKFSRTYYDILLFFLLFLFVGLCLFLIHLLLPACIL